MTLPRYVLIAGHGRSGTNWLLDLMNLSPLTHCRNEPNEIQGSPLNVLPGAQFAGVGKDVLTKSWDDAIEKTVARIGERDPRPLSPKQHVWSISRALGLDAFLYRPRLRSFATRVQLLNQNSEWSIPFWLGDQRLLTNALAIIKLVQTPGWVTWVLKNRPDVLVLHIVRHPGGFLNSWHHRYVAYAGIEAVKRENVVRIKSLATLNNFWQSQIHDIESMSVDETELWYWKYSTETIHNAGSDLKNYELIVYENLARDSREIAKRIYERCGLTWSQEVDAAISASSKGSLNIASAWKDGLDAKQIQLAEKFAGSTFLEDEW